MNHLLSSWDRNASWFSASHLPPPPPSPTPLHHSRTSRAYFPSLPTPPESSSSSSHPPTARSPVALLTSSSSYHPLLVPLLYSPSSAILTPPQPLIYSPHEAVFQPTDHPLTLPPTHRLTALPTLAHCPPSLPSSPSISLMPRLFHLQPDAHLQPQDLKHHSHILFNLLSFSPPHHLLCVHMSPHAIPCCPNSFPHHTSVCRTFHPPFISVTFHSMRMSAILTVRIRGGD